jgi:hypothetical protein
MSVAVHGTRRRTLVFFRADELAFTFSRAVTGVTIQLISEILP